MRYLVFIWLASCLLVSQEYSLSDNTVQVVVTQKDESYSIQWQKKSQVLETSLPAPLEVTAKKNVLILHSSKSALGLIINEVGIHSFASFSWAEAEDHFVINDAWFLDLDNGYLSPLSKKEKRQRKILALKAKDIHAELEQEKNKIAALEAQHRTAVREFFQIEQKYQEKKQLLLAAEEKKKEIEEMGEKLLIQQAELKKSFVIVESSVATLRVEKKVLLRSIEIVNENLDYVQKKLKEEGDKWISIKEEVRKDSRRLIRVMDEMDTVKQERNQLLLEKSKLEKEIAEMKTKMSSSSEEDNPSLEEQDSSSDTENEDQSTG